jgi:hypothetical protein
MNEHRFTYPTVVPLGPLAPTPLAAHRPSGVPSIENPSIRPAVRAQLPVSAHSPVSAPLPFSALSPVGTQSAASAGLRSANSGGSPSTAS